MDKVIVFDTTLRDGEQSPGAAMDIQQKVEIAHCLSDMGVDVIESGFPISSQKQYQASELISKEVKNTTVAALARAVEKDIDIAAEAIQAAENPRIHTFLASSPIHREYKLKKSKEEILAMTKHAVAYARNKCAEVQFSPEDATRTELDFLAQVVETAIAAGASTVNIPDTVGYITPGEMAHTISYLIEHVTNIDKCILAVHCHDDLGLAVANTLSGLKAGARQVEVTINGIGERAGNAALEEVIMGLVIRKDIWQLETNIITEKIYPISKLLSNTIGFPIPRNKAIIGENAFAHESGIHQDGVLKHRATYEILTPAKVGIHKNNIILGRHSGLHGFTSRLKQLNLHVSEDKIQDLFAKFSDLADKKKEVYDEDIYALISESSKNIHKYLKMQSLELFIEPNKTPMAKIIIQNENQELIEYTATGDGPIDALFSAISQSISEDTKLLEYHVHAVTPGKEAVGEAVVVLDIENKEFTGRANSTDIFEASALAYFSALNNYLLFKSYSKE